MRIATMLHTAIEYAFTYAYSRDYYYFAGYFWYVKSHMQTSNMRAFCRIPLLNCNC